MKHWIETYPHMVYASVLLLDGKIENWKVGQNKWIDTAFASHSWDIGRIGDYKTQYIGWYCKTPEEHAKVFNELAPKWFRQWKYAKDYRLYRAY